MLRSFAYFGEAAIGHFATLSDADLPKRASAVKKQLRRGGASAAASPTTQTAADSDEPVSTAVLPKQPLLHSLMTHLDALDVCGTPTGGPVFCWWIMEGTNIE